MSSEKRKRSKLELTGCPNVQTRTGNHCRLCEQVAETVFFGRALLLKKPHAVGKKPFVGLPMSMKILSREGPRSVLPNCGSRNAQKRARTASATRAASVNLQVEETSELLHGLEAQKLSAHFTCESTEEVHQTPELQSC